MNLLEIKHDLLGRPLKEFTRRMGPSEHWTDESVLTAIYLGGVTAAANLMPAATLIQSGYRGNRYFSHLSYAKSSIGFPMPRFNYVTPFSAAERLGARVGGRIGARAGTRAAVLGGAKFGARVGGRLIPGVGWALLAYDVYDIAANRSLWGFDLS